MRDFLQKYSLAVPPFEPSALDPLKVADHARLLSPVSGAATLKEVEKKLKGAAASREAPLFALVTGGESCGLNSVANYLLAQYAQFRQTAPQNFIVPDRVVSDNDEHGFWLNWLSLLSEAVKKRKLGVDGNFLKEFSDALNNTEQGKLHIRFRSLLSLLSDELSNLDPAADFAVCVKQPRNQAIVERALQLFSSSPVLCVFIVGDYADGRDKVIKQFDEYEGEKITVRMTPLLGNDVETVIEHRWQVANAEVKNPFEPKGLTKAFENRPRPIKRVMVLMNKVLEHKSIVEHPQKQWPTDAELGFSVDDLVNRIKVMDDDVWGKKQG